MPETSPWLNLGTEFLSALISGGVAGLIAGWVLLKMQVRTQLELEDVSRSIRILHSVEAAKDKTNPIVFGDPPDFDEVYSYVVETLRGVSSEAQHLRTKRYKLLRAYLVLRIKYGRIENASSKMQLHMGLLGLERDIREYIGFPRSKTEFIKYWWKRLTGIRGLLTGRLTKVQKAIIKKAGSQHNPAHPYELLPTVGTKEDVLDELVKIGYMEQPKSSVKYGLTRRGWKKAVQLMRGDYDLEVGFRAN